MMIFVNDNGYEYLWGITRHCPRRKSGVDYMDRYSFYSYELKKRIVVLFTFNLSTKEKQEFQS